MIRVSLWTAAFLILLRIAIGWHFFFEGVSKVKSTYAGKPFTSETFFRESEGPIGKFIKSKIGDPDQELLEKLTPRTVEGEPGSVAPSARFPAPLDKEWEDYYGRFVTQYKLNDEQQKLVRTQLDKSKANYLVWLQSLTGEKDEKGKPKELRLTAKRKSPAGAADFDEELTVAKRIEELRNKAAAVREAYEQKLPQFGKDVEGPNLRTLKSDAADVRKDLQKEVDAQTDKMKDALSKAVFGGRPTAQASPPKGEENAFLQSLLTPMAGGKNPLAQAWDEYAAYAKEYSPNATDETKARIDRALANAKERFDRWLADQDPYTGQALERKPFSRWQKDVADAESNMRVAKDDSNRRDAQSSLDGLWADARADLKTYTDVLRGEVGSMLGDERATGYASKADENFLGVVPKNWTPIQYLDWSTRWFLPVVGSMLMFGIFTRLSCFAAAGFLLITILTQMPLPWLPSPPNQEGTYLFVSKNAIEMLALLALMGARTGQWAGVDALIKWAFGRKRG